MSFHNRMMNIAVDPVAMSSAHKPGSLHLAYKIGHKDARHAAAEIANEADAEIARLTKCLEVANAQAEKFEREWYLRGDVLDATEYWLGSLLAVIHRDGGHYQAEHGMQKASDDAITAVHVLRGTADDYAEANKYMKGELDDALEDARKNAEAQREIARLREALTDALCALEVCGKNYDYTMDKARAALENGGG